MPHAQWTAVDRWIVEDGEPLCQVDLPANAATLVLVHNDLVAALSVAVQRADTAEARVQAALRWMSKADPLPHLNGDRMAPLRAALSGPVRSDS